MHWDDDWRVWGDCEHVLWRLLDGHPRGPYMLLDLKDIDNSRFNLDVGDALSWLTLDAYLPDDEAQSLILDAESYMALGGQRCTWSLVDVPASGSTTAAAGR